MKDRIRVLLLKASSSMITEAEVKDFFYFSTCEWWSILINTHNIRTLTSVKVSIGIAASLATVTILL